LSSVWIKEDPRNLGNLTQPVNPASTGSPGLNSPPGVSHMSVGDVGRKLVKLEKDIRFSLTGVPLDVLKMIAVSTIHM